MKTPCCIRSLAFLFIISNATLILFSCQSEPSAQETSTMGQKSPYTVDVIIPEYDHQNNAHFLIKSESDWDHINDRDKRFFYVEPHFDYGTVTIKADGTKNKPRFISLHNSNDLHPGKLERSEQANVSLVFDDAHFWIADRMSCFGSSHTVGNRSQNIVLNRFYFEDFATAITIKGNADAPFLENITIQNSRLYRMTAAGIDDDRVAIMLIGEQWNAATITKNVKILNNEIKNCSDGIMLISFPQLDGGHFVSHEGTIIDNNHIYVDNDVYTDGNGNHDPNGTSAWTEDAIDIRAGSNDPANPIIISNNYLWGTRRTDQNGGGSGGTGAILTAHYWVKNIVIKNNVFFNGPRGISFADPFGLPYSVENASIYGNIFYDLGHRATSSIEYAAVISNTNNVKFENNTIIGADNELHWLSLSDNEQYMVSCNVIIDTYKWSGISSATMENNAFYHTEMQQPGDGVSYETASEAKMEDLTFTTDIYTNAPRKITLPGVLSTPSSPHVVKGCFELVIVMNATF